MLRRLRNYLVNEGAKLIVLVLWLGINATLFYFTFSYYYYGPEFYYLHEMLGYGLCVSRATAACINLNACLILLPMCRGVLRIVRSFPWLFRQLRRLTDKSKSFHIACGYMLCLLSAVHCGAHAFNAYNFCEHFNAKYLGINVATFPHQNPVFLVVTSLPGVTGLLMVASLTTIAVTASSPMRTANYRRFWKIHHLFIIFYLLLLLHACSGILKYQSNTNEHIPGCYVSVDGSGQERTVVLPEPEDNILAFSEPEPFDSGVQALPKRQFHAWSEPRHHPMPEGEGHYFPIPEPEGHHHPIPEGEPGSNMQPCQQPQPQFKSCPTEAWMWLSIPLFFYLLERISRYVGSAATPIQIKNFKQHPNDVIEIEFSKEDFKAQPGQSVWLRCPEVSFIESHPFTLTSIPTKERPYFTIHMLVSGRWTSTVRDLILNSQPKEVTECEGTSSRADQRCVIEMGSMQEGQTSERTDSLELEAMMPSKHHQRQEKALPSFFAHGPYGSAMQDTLRYEVSLCIAGGIGITPFAAVLNMILQQSELVTTSKMRRIYLVWMCKKIESFEWFVDLINSTLLKLWNTNRPDFLNVSLHVTSSSSLEDQSTDLQNLQLERCRVFAGRPEFKDMFEDLSVRHKGTSIGVFCCGPRSLNDCVRQRCMRVKGRNVRFVFNKESF